jgi:hypothetical protein
MSDEQNEPKESVDFFGPPPLLRGEDEALYRALLAEVERMIEPKTILDRMDARDITDKIWEAQRYKRLEPRLIESASVSALANLLVPVFIPNSVAAFEAANMYYGQDSRKRRVAADLLAHYKITDEMILARALAQSGSAIGNIDRLIAARERSRNNLFKDHQRRRESAAKLANIEEAKTSRPATDKAYRIKPEGILPANINIHHGDR